MAEFSILTPDTIADITASVGLVSPLHEPELYVEVLNARGWDIPGGHLETGETPEEAFARELSEESGCTLLPDVGKIAILGSSTRPGTGIAVFSGWCTRGEYHGLHETTEVRFVTAEQLLQDYFGDKDLLKALLELANARLAHKLKRSD